jgi:hypothetical protein
MVFGATDHHLGAGSPIRFDVDVPLLPGRPWGSSRPPTQANCTTGRSGRTDAGRRRLPEQTFTIPAWSRQTVSPKLRAAPASIAACDLSASPPEVCWPGSLVTPDQREVSPLLRRGDVATPIRPITGRPSLSPSSFTRCPVGSPCGSLSPRPPWFTGQGETTGLPRSADVPEWIGRISTPVARHLRRRSSGPPNLATHLLVQAVQQLALVLCDDAYDALPGLAIPLDPGSRPPCCWQSQLRLAPWLPSRGPTSP